ncbi:hypothetical protein F5Y14DRAFT_432546 [Nemania sp. NC0429]|nr:hypothetical protein F5Y14DRAFT_432546 [Nemania sp. NC0429]
MCNCKKFIDQPINCWEVEEALRLIAAKCGPEQGGRVYLHRKREIGLSSINLIRYIRKINTYATLCHDRDCCTPGDVKVRACGRVHPSNEERLGEGCGMQDEPDAQTLGDGESNPSGE